MYDVAIIGAGPAGASAALFTAKAGKKTLVFDNEKSFTKKAWLDNHYGANGVTGPDLVETGKAQATKFGAEIVNETVVNVIAVDGGYKVTTETGEYQAKHVVVATGYSADLAESIGLDVVPGAEPRIKSIVKVDEQGQTSKKGLWAVGPIAGVSPHTIIAAGHGAAVAVNIISELNGSRYIDHDVMKA